MVSASVCEQQYVVFPISPSLKGVPALPNFRCLLYCPRQCWQCVKEEELALLYVVFYGSLRVSPLRSFDVV